MTETSQTTISSSFRRTVQVKQFEPMEVEIRIEETHPGTIAADDLQRLIGSQMAHVKSRVFSELGLNFEQNQETGIIMEHFPDSNVVEMRPAPVAPPTPVPAAESFQPVAPAAPVADTPVWPAQPEAPAQPVAPAAPAEDPWALLANDPGDWYDNRTDKQNPNSPDFKSATRPNPKKPEFKLGLWIKDMPAGFPIDQLAGRFKNSK